MSESDGYDDKSCNALERPFYRPVEAALRWCGLIEHEAQILAALDSDGIPKPGQFPKWPCLQANTEKILDAVLHGNIPRGRDGKSVPQDEQVARPRLTVRHADLRDWMAKHYPDQKPGFLFDELSRNTHAAIKADSFLALQADLQRAQTELRTKESLLGIVTRERDSLLIQRGQLEQKVSGLGVPEARAETTYQNIVGALLGLLLGQSPSGKPNSVFKSQSAVIDAIEAHYPEKGGLKKRTLEEKFAEARRSIDQS
jgi:hypothetical protein